MKNKYKLRQLSDIELAQWIRNESIYWANYGVTRGERIEEDGPYFTLERYLEWLEADDEEDWKETEEIRKRLESHFPEKRR